MPQKRDYYQTLNVNRGASQEEIRKAYRRLARKYHPDLNPGDKAAEERFKNIQEAYDILGEAKKRQMYDQFGFYSEHGMPPAGGGARPDAGMGFSGFDFSDFFTSGAGARAGAGAAGAGGGFRDLFSQFFGQQAQANARQPERGQDLEYAHSIDFWSAIRGSQQRLSINRHETCQVCGGTGSSSGSAAKCPQCDGTGQVAQMAGAMRFNLSCPRCGGTGKLSNACGACHGDGRVSRTETVEVRIPPGTRTGSRLRVAGKGSAGTQGMPAGDLYITLRVEDHPYFRRDGDNIEIRLPVTVWEAGLGTKIEVPTIDGFKTLKIPPGTQNGQKFRMREKGVISSRSGQRGDQIVEVVLTAPDIRDERMKDLLRQMSQVPGDDPRGGLWPADTMN